MMLDACPPPPPASDCSTESVRRARALAFVQGLADEGLQLQSMPDASPAKWHLGHTTWFFETLVLAPHDLAHAPFDPRFGPLFNSYHEALGPRHPRPLRGLLSRPTRAELRAWRASVDAALAQFIEDADADTGPPPRRWSNWACSMSSSIRN
jgi:hypothetical protein